MTEVSLRPPSKVMRLARMGSFHQSRLSFMRVLLRRMQHEGWTFTRPRFDIDANGVGTALYSAHTGERTYTLVAFAHDLPDDQRSDRVIATAWDATFTLHDGMPTDVDVERLRANVPLQEVGRVSERELTLSRANRSVRLWDSVINALASGEQPNVDDVERVGYLMRTTAVYGSGKFGAADRERIADRPELNAPFQAEMLTVYLIRAFVLDMVEHLASLRSSTQAATLDPAIRRRFGIGNSTGLGMAPFLMTHPRLIHHWVAAREEALRRVRSIDEVSETEVDIVRRALAGVRRGVDTWLSEHPVQQAKLADLRADLDLVSEYLDGARETHRQWDVLIRWAEDALSLEGQELVVSLVLEPYGELIDALADTMATDESRPVPIDGTLTVSDALQRIGQHYDWALQIDWEQRTADARAWYVSEEKLEPRLGERHDEPIADYEQPLQPGRDIAQLFRTLSQFAKDTSLDTVLRAHPECRHAARRLMLADEYPYAEIRDNTIDADMMPIDLLRAKLSFFGATRFDPRSDRWVRITMFQGAPFPHELAEYDLAGWSYPPHPDEPVAR